MKDKHGGHAFPSPEWSDAHGTVVPAEYGMTLRDYFAAKAMLGILCDPHHDTGDMGGYQSIAEYAFFLADAMLAAREK